MVLWKPQGMGLMMLDADARHLTSVFKGKKDAKKDTVMFNCSLLSKTCLNVYRPSSLILSLPGTSCKLLSSAPPVSLGDPW